MPLFYTQPYEVTGTVEISEASLPLPVTGTVSVSGTQEVTGTIGVSGPVEVFGSGVFQVTGSVGIDDVTVSNFPTGFDSNITASITLPVSATSLPPITGTVHIDNPVSQVTASISGVVTVSQSNGWVVTEKRASQAVLTTASFTNTTSVSLAANPNRIGATIFNPATPTAFVALATTASLTRYSVQVGSKGYYELPENYTGPVSTITTVTGPGTLFITELVAP